MKAKNIAVSLCAGILAIATMPAIAGSYAPAGSQEDVAPSDTVAYPGNNTNPYVTSSSNFVYVDLGVNYYEFKFPDYTIPVSLGTGSSSSGYVTNSPGGVDGQDFNAQPGFTLGYSFVNTNEALAHLFGDRNQVELSYVYYHNSGDTTTNYDYAAGVPWFINGDPLDPDPSHTNGITYFLIDTSNVDYDQRYYNISLILKGDKRLENNWINQPFLGLVFSRVTNDDDYSVSYWEKTSGTNQPAPGTQTYTTGSDNLSSDYFGVTLGDKVIIPIKRKFAAFVDGSVDLLGLHSTLDSTQVYDTYEGYLNANAYYHDERDVDQSDTIFTYRARAEVGLNMYLKDNKDPNSPVLSLLAGVEYWHDVPYADDPQEENTSVKISYDHAVNPYVGLQLHLPLG